MKTKKIKKTFKKIRELFNDQIVVNIMEFNNEDDWKVLYKLWFTGVKEVVFNNQRYTINYHQNIPTDTSTPRFEINELSNDEILILDES